MDFINKDQGVYTHRVKPNASRTMSSIIEFPAGQIDSGMDEKICRITLILEKERNLNKRDLKTYERDMLYQIKILGKRKEYLVMESLLEDLDQNDYIYINKTDEVNEPW